MQPKGTNFGLMQGTIALTPMVPRPALKLESKVRTFPERKVGEQRGAEVVAVEGEAVVDHGGGEPEVVDDQGLLPQVGGLEELQEPEVAFSFAVEMVRMVVKVLIVVLLENSDNCSVS